MQLSVHSGYRQLHPTESYISAIRRVYSFSGQVRSGAVTTMSGSKFFALPRHFFFDYCELKKVNVCIKIQHFLMSNVRAHQKL